MTAEERADELHYAQSTQLPSREVREMFQRVFLGSAEGRMVFAFLIDRYGGERPILGERQRHQHNLIVDIKNIIGWGHHLPAVRAIVEQLHTHIELLSLEETKHETTK